MNILTFDLEDWFHILDFNETAKPEQWLNFGSRLEVNTDRILNLLEKKNLRATFFCLGWVAQKFPALIKKISLKHEIACHSMNHQLLQFQSRTEFVNDLKEATHLLEDITGNKIISYRAPGFSLDKKHYFVFEELQKLNYKIDCSIFPAKRNHGGISNFEYQKPCRIVGDNFDLLELPLNTTKIFFRKIVFSGGGYFRLLPYSFIKSQMKKTNYVMTYFHPRDFDPTQPMLKGLPFKRKLMSYSGLNSSYAKFERLLNDFDFISVDQAEKLIAQTKLPSVNL